MADNTRPHRNHRTQWTIAEITFVEQHHGRLSASEIGEKIGRTTGAVVRQASLLGLTDCGRWSHEEKAFLKKHYGNLSAQKIADRLGRSASAVRAAVVKLKLGKWHNRPWTEAELALMRMHYRKEIDGMTILLPERTRGGYFCPGRKNGSDGNPILAA
ncbi:TPA: hypothetical protein I8Y04_000747 [Raoultella planticola]|uniref:hypothetical protein n=1 Tax=Raoultella planticola TaxID=575 RepID=UPI001A2F81AC|nr:hypothetical protein [Raoultella planticola]